MGDWDDGTAGGGNLLPGLVSGGQIAQPIGAGPAGAGALFLSSPADFRNGGPSEAVTNDLFITFSLTADTTALEVQSLSFYASLGNSAPNRGWDNWFLDVDTGSGFTTLASGTPGTIPSDSTWGLETATFSPFVVPTGSTATFRLGGVAGTSSQFGRGTAIDDITVMGVPEPSVLGLSAVVMLGLALRRRR